MYLVSPASEAKRCEGSARANLVLLALFLLGGLLFVGAAAEARSESAAVRACKELQPGFATLTKDLVSRFTHGGDTQPSVVHLTWRDEEGTFEDLVCYFLPLSRTAGQWQLDRLESSRFGFLQRYDIMQLMKFLRPGVQELLQQEASELRSASIERQLAYAAQQAISLIGLTGLYGLLAIGFTLTLSVGGVFNLAYGLIYAFAAFQAWIAFFVAQDILGAAWLWLGLPLLALGLGGGAAAGYVTSAIVLAPGRLAFSTGRLAIVASLGLLIAGQEAMRLLQGPETYWLPYRDGGTWLLARVEGFSLVLGKGQALVTLLAVGSLVALHRFLGQTRSGRNLRAVADDPGAAVLLGVNLGQSVALATALGGLLAALAGTFAFFTFGAVNFHLGAVIGFKALAAAILGGVGSPVGALLGAAVIALTEVLVVVLGFGGWKEAAVFVLLVATLLFRPQGLLGHNRLISPEFVSAKRAPF